MRHCDLEVLSFTNITLPNLRIMDLSDNLLTSLTLHVFNELGNLVELSLSRNPVTHLYAGDSDLTSGLLQLDLAGLQVG